MNATTLSTHDPTIPDRKSLSAGRRQPLLEREGIRLCLGVLLTTAAGWVDAVGYLRLQGLYLSFMSGNSMAFGVTAATGDWPPIAAGALLIAFFVAGALAGTIVAEAAGAWSVPATLAFGASLLGAALGLSMAGWGPSYALAPVVLAMGVQNVALPSLAGVRLGATFVTGTLVSVGQEMGRALLGQSGGWVWRRHALVWVGLVAGAAAGADRASLDALLPPAVLVAALAAACAVAVALERRRRRPLAAGRAVRSGGLPTRTAAAALLGLRRNGGAPDRGTTTPS